jgi:2-polyprenyl-6-methoxyphenol hydroxylase-like FAD-dependent oxidoreductase
MAQVIEPAPPNPTSTRAMAHQPLIFPLFASAGLMPDLSSLGSFSSGLCFRTSVAHGSKLIAGKLFKEDEKAQLLLPQYKFQELLISKVKEISKGTVLMGKKVVGFEESQDSVKITLAEATAGDGEDNETYENLDENDASNEHETETMEAVYLLGADGAHSTIRRLLSLPFEGTTLPTQLVATDIIFDFRTHNFYDANFIIDPEHYGLIGRIDNNGLWRVSYGVPADTSDDEIRNGVDAKLQKMLPKEGKGEDGRNAYEVKRIAPYRAQQRAVSSFWPEGGRIGILGDAAHCESCSILFYF